MPPMIQRLKEKKIVQWAIAYLAGAFVVLQLMDALEGALNLSQQAQQSILALLASGLVATTIVAWFHGDKGQQRIRPAELIALGVTLVVGVSASAMLWRSTEGPSTPGGPLEAASVSALLPSPQAVGIDSDPVADTDRRPIVGGSKTLANQDPATEANESESLPAVEPSASVPEESSAEGHGLTPQETPPPALSPENPTVFVGDSVRLELDTDQPAIWTSSDRSVAMVTTDGFDGLVMTMGPGSTRITATVGEAEVSTLLTVRAVVATEVEIIPVESMQPGQSVRPEVLVRMSNGETRGRAGLQWASSDSTVIRIGNRGTLSAVGPGFARITAERDEVEGIIDVTVETEPETPPPPQPASADVLFPVLEAYRVALEGKDLEAVTAIYPDISQEEKDGWKRLFGLGDLSVEFSGLAVAETSSTSATVDFEQVLSGDRIERNVTRFVAAFVPMGGEWRIQRLLAIGS